MSATTLTDLDGPAIEPPDGVTPNFEIQNRHHAVGYFVLIFCAILSTLAVILRLASRYHIGRFHIEDVFFIMGYGIFAGYLYPIYEVSIWPGVQVHQWDIKLRDISRVNWMIHLGSINYGMSILFVKLAILLDWLRIFVPLGQKNKMYWMFHALIWGNIIYYVSGTFLEIFRCWPRQKIWDPLFEGGSCPIDIAANNFASALINLASDIAILLLPQWIIWKLHVSKSKRIGISLLFVIGIFATGAGVARLVYLLQLLDSDDEWYWISSVALWGVGEITAGLLITGIPGIPKVVQSIQSSESFTQLLSRLGISTSRLQSEPSGGRPSLRTFGRNQTPQKRRGLWDISDADTYGLVSVQAIPVDQEAHSLQQPPNSITRETGWDVNVERQQGSDEPRS
ncbi:hypothetical protein KVR01_012803 [Diaporthe batatas]|uniref:uncharacterized protein n=1 Tax=Diaporthe batatas TaxID=748121 RepID=UPI001D057B3C|nr:uncharacterized protein KVR01_012803 [Diaporthe batatas]KAG8157419.1 hypothetical protein KVR01_012803 [Diaporthe batatas]